MGGDSPPFPFTSEGKEWRWSTSCMRCSLSSGCFFYCGGLLSTSTTRTNEGREGGEGFPLPTPPRPGVGTNKEDVVPLGISTPRPGDLVLIRRTWYYLVLLPRGDFPSKADEEDVVLLSTSPPHPGRLRTNEEDLVPSATTPPHPRAPRGN